MTQASFVAGCQCQEMSVAECDYSISLTWPGPRPPSSNPEGLIMPSLTSPNLGQPPASLHCSQTSAISFFPLHYYLPPSLLTFLTASLASALAPVQHSVLTTRCGFRKFCKQEKLFAAGGSQHLIHHLCCCVSLRSFM